MVETKEWDLFVIGGGSGGVRAARMAAQRGARVAMAEALGTAGLGGTCVNVGCIPKKLYSYAAHYADAFEEARGFGWQLDAPRFDWDTLKARRRAEITRLNGIYGRLLENAGVTVLPARATLEGPNTVRVDGVLHQARHILVATGGTPHVPDIPGREFVDVSDAMFDLDPLPRRLLVVGGGYIASEFASIFTGLGVQVTQLYRGDQILRGFDDDVRAFVAAEMRKSGVDLRLGSDVAAIARGPDGLHVQLKGEGRDALVVDRVLYATGRVPNVKGLGLEALGVQQREDGAIVVDDVFRTSVHTIHAVGDVSTRLQLTPVALAEAMVLVDHLFGAVAGKAVRQMDYDNIPTAVFTHPNIGTVGLGEAQARERYGAVTIFKTDFKPLRHTLSGSEERMFMKLVVDTASDRVVGLHMVGADAGEVVQGFAVALKAGATKAIFDATIGIHPTAAEEFVTMREPVR
jgi:glutathione reductase (NADPH)